MEYARFIPLTPQALTPQALTPQALTPQALTPQSLASLRPYIIVDERSQQEQLWEQLRGHILQSCGDSEDHRTLRYGSVTIMADQEDNEDEDNEDNEDNKDNDFSREESLDTFCMPINVTSPTQVSNDKVSNDKVPNDKVAAVYRRKSRASNRQKERDH
jgi:hypothetical protein